MSQLNLPPTTHRTIDHAVLLQLVTQVLDDGLPAGQATLVPPMHFARPLADDVEAWVRYRVTTDPITNLNRDLDQARVLVLAYPGVRAAATRADPMRLERLGSLVCGALRGVGKVIGDHTLEMDPDAPSVDQGADGELVPSRTLIVSAAGVVSRTGGSGLITPAS